MSSEPTIIVDGYNLMHQILAARIVGGPGGLERGRCAVIQRVRHLVPHKDHSRTAIVFDANTSDIPRESRETAGGSGMITILFATDFPDADSMIEDMIRRHSSPTKLTVVSSDRRLVDAARRRQATGVDCQTWMDDQEDLIEKLSRGTPVPDSTESGHSPIVDANERDYWMKEFGFGSGDDDPAIG
jgi:predicted RNA-binding protein with PIN domain